MAAVHMASTPAEDSPFLSTFRDSNFKINQNSAQSPLRQASTELDDSKSSTETSNVNISGHSYFDNSFATEVSGKRTKLSASTTSAALAMCDTLAEFSKLV